LLNKELHLFQNHTSVGLTFSDYSVRMVRFKGNVEDLSRLQCWKERLQPGIVENGRIKDMQAFTDVLKTLVHTLKVRHKRTFFAIPDAQLVLRQFDLPGILSDSELQNYFFIEIGHKIQLPFEKAVFDFHVLDRSATGTHALLFAAPETTVRQYQKALSAAGLYPVSAEFSALGIDR
jgi:Tfp pilus assembly protein, ATPase PilM